MLFDKIVLVLDLKEAFMLFDYRKNGTISSRDIGAVIRSVGLKPTESEVAQIREEVDRTGKVTDPPPTRTDDIREMFAIYDTKKSGRISLAEMRHLLTTVGEKLSEEEADDLLKMTNCVENGSVVDYNRFVQAVMH
ncbi:hypothetical protein NP493_896g01039 [Ridgeia piscesae]|uniref:EF-hand domain-containing protein n=1 Tax=Ridgeia piscesae TaxID=27915 RepID=A0AAD9KKK7_RIDPI|nr:hypothetical protein NP493_896g01039 [Ridgeia piscesae]